MLPAAAIAEQLNAALSERHAAVVIAPPGAGKSTLLPLTMLKALPEGRIIMLEPRRMAARQVAMRMAQLLDEPVGQTVGYQVRFERKVSAKTRIEVVTEGILSRRMTDDPTLDGVSCIIFDEFHERSLQTDLTFCSGKMFPVDIVHTNADAAPSQIADAVAAAVSRAHREHEGDILAFLPGQADIMRCAERLADSLGPTTICPLYGNLPADRQQAAIAPSPEGQRKVVLATPIAETSITIEGVRIVVDSGYCRQLVYDATTGLSHLDTVRISRDMARQRAGRAGRVAPGICYELWTAATDLRMDENRQPEILYADLTPMALDIAAFGETDIQAMPWLTPNCGFCTPSPPTATSRRSDDAWHCCPATRASQE